MKPRSDALTLISIYHLVVGLLSLLVTCAVVTIPALVGVSLAGSGDRGAGEATVIVGIVALFIGGLFLLISVANVMVGWGLWQRREWARIGAIGLAVIRLLNVPLGTLIGGLIIWYLLNQEGRQEFLA